MRIFDRSPDSLKRSDFTANYSGSEVRREEYEGEKSEMGVDGELEGCGEEFEKRNLQNVGKLSPEVLTCIQKLESELSVVKKVRELLFAVFIFPLQYLLTIEFLLMVTYLQVYYY